MLEPRHLSCSFSPPLIFFSFKITILSLLLLFIMCSCFGVLLFIHVSCCQPVLELLEGSEDEAEAQEGVALLSFACGDSR